MDKEETTKPEFEDRIDEHAISMFGSLGRTGRLSENTILIYKHFKSNKDRLMPGRATPEAFAFVCFLADMADGVITTKKSKPAAKEE